MSDTVAGDRILSFVERIETIEENLKNESDARKDVYAEAKGEGFDVKTIKEIVARRKKDRDQLDEAETILELYERAIREAESDNGAGD